MLIFTKSEILAQWHKTVIQLLGRLWQQDYRFKFVWVKDWILGLNGQLGLKGKTEKKKQKKKNYDDN